MNKLALILFCATLGCVAQVPAKYSATVRLVISNGTSERDTLTNQFNSFIGRELRSLGDIKIGDEQPDYVVNIIVSKLTNAAGEAAGFSAATLITRPTRPEILADSALKLKGTLENWQFQALALIIRGDVSIVSFNLRTGGLNDIQSTCQELIADFDTNTLNSQRVMWDALNKPLGAKPK